MLMRCRGSPILLTFTFISFIVNKFYISDGRLAMKLNHKARVRETKFAQAQAVEHPHAFTWKISKSRKARIDREQYKGRVKTVARRINRGERRVTNMECVAARHDGRDIDNRPLYVLARANQQY